VRAFVALVPPDDALAELAAAVAVLPHEPRLRWSPRGQWHLTLAFLGEVDELARDRLRRHHGIDLAEEPARARGR